MKNKRLLVILVIFFVIALLAIMGSVVFSIKKITVRFNNELDYFVSASATDADRAAATKKLQDDVAESFSYLMGRSIFFNVNTAKITKIIEREEGGYEGFRLRVTSVKAIAPSEIIITIRERYPVYKYTMGTKTVILDGDLRVLDTKIPIDKATGIPRRLIELSTALPGVVLDDLIVGQYLDTADEARTGIIKEIVPFFARLENNEDAVTHIFSSIVFVESKLLWDGETTAPALFMTQYVQNPKESPQKNYFDIVIIDPSINLQKKFTKVWMAVNDKNYNQKPGEYEVLDWPGDQDNLRVNYNAR